ncbi:unnamed protein product [Arabidopsis halleri]
MAPKNNRGKTKGDEKKKEENGINHGSSNINFDKIKGDEKKKEENVLPVIVDVIVKPSG